MLDSNLMLLISVLYIGLPLPLTALLFFLKPEVKSPFGPEPRRFLWIGNAVVICLLNSLYFKGRSNRSEFWWFFLFAFTVLQPVGFLILQKNEILGWIAYGVSVIPVLAVGTRRLHDIGRSGLWQLLFPLGLGVIVLVVLWCLPSQKDRVFIAEAFE